MSNVPTNLIPSTITQLPEYAGASTLGYLPYSLDGRTYKVQFANIAAAGAVPSTRTIATGNGLQGGGDLSQNRTISIIPHGVGYSQLDFTGVTAGTYGSADTIPSLTVDATGRITAAVGVPVVLPNYVPSSRTVTAGAGLTGGGQLNNNITVALNPSNATPQSLGAASAGTGTQAARDDHVHPAVDLTDTSETQGVLPLGRGGTGVALSPVVGAVIYADNDSLNQTIAGNAGQILTSAGGLGAPYWQTVTGTGTVTSVAMTVPTGLQVTGSPITASGTLAVTLQSGYSIPTIASQANWDTAYTDRLKWDGGAAGLVAATGRASLGASTVGGSFFTLTNPSAITFPRINADNTVSALDAAAFRTAIGAGAGTVTSVDASGGTTGLTFTGGPITTSGTLTLGGTLSVANGGTGATTAVGARANLGSAASGANSDITSLSGVTGSISAPTYIQYGSGSGTTLVAGRMWYNEITGSMNVGMGGGNITQQIGEELFVYGKASAAIADNPLQIVYQTGTVGASGVVTFGPTVASIANGDLILGIATEDIAMNGFGRITSFGIVRGIATNGTAYGETWADGDTIWYNAVTGNPTNVKPSAPNIKVSVGTLIKAAAGGSGSIQVEINHGSVLGGTDSNVQLTTPTNNDLLQYYSAGPYWRNLAPSSVAVGTATNLAGGAANRIAYQTGAGATGFVVAPVSANTYLEWSGSAFQWSANPLGTVTSVSGTGTVNGITLTGTVTSSGSLTLGGALSGINLTSQVTGTLPVTNGGTGATSLTSGYLVKGNGASAASASVVYDDGTNVGIGTAGPTTKLDVVGGHIRMDDGYKLRWGDGTAAWEGNGASDVLLGYTNNSERMRIDASGNVGIGTSGPSSRLDVRASSGTTAVISSYNTTTSGDASNYYSDLQSNANSTSSYHYAGVTQGVNIWYLYGNGTSSWTSDQRLKKNIVTTRDGYLDDLNKLRVVRYNWRADADDKPQELGLIAQEVEEVFPGLVEEALHTLDDTDIKYKVLKGSVLPYMLLKALQEASAKIDALTARVAQLEGN